MKDLISLADYDAEGLYDLLELAKHLKREHKAGIQHTVLAGKTLAMVFQKPSLRTRVSFEVGMTQLGGTALYLGPDDIKLGQRETTEDIALVLSGYADGIMARVFSHGDVEALAKHAGVPVINGLSDHCHPCQILGDLLTIWEKKRTLEGLKLVFVGDGNNVAHSWLNAAPQLGIELTVACPEGYDPDERVLAFAQRFGPKVSVSHDPQTAVIGAGVVYTDVWASMGQEAEAQQRQQRFEGFQLNADLVGRAQPGCLVMHCLPAHYGEEISYEVAHSEHSVIFDEAENRLHAQKAVLATLMT